MLGERALEQRHGLVVAALVGADRGEQAEREERAGADRAGVARRGVAEREALLGERGGPLELARVAGRQRGLADDVGVVGIDGERLLGGRERLRRLARQAERLHEPRRERRQVLRRPPAGA